jgi:hypothetical protein
VQSVTEITEGKEARYSHHFIYIQQEKLYGNFLYLLSYKLIYFGFCFGHCATCRKVVGSILDGVTRIFR